jgi:hypothetical protein
MTFNFGEVLNRAFQIIRRHKVLWVFGILAGCNRGATYVNSDFEDLWGRGMASVSPNLQFVLDDLLEAFAEGNISKAAVMFGVGFLMIWLAITSASMLGRIGLISGTFQVDNAIEKVYFENLFKDGKLYFWRVFGLSVLAGIPALIVFAILLARWFLLFLAGLAFDGGDSSAWDRMFLTVLSGSCLFIPVKFVVDLIVRQAHNAIVLENLHVLSAIRHGWNVFFKNIGTMVLTAILLIVIGLVVGLIIAIPLAMIVVPFTLAFRVWDGQSELTLLLLGLQTAVVIPVTLALNGIWCAFREAVWTLTYLRLTRAPHETQTMLQPSPA